MKKLITLLLALVLCLGVLVACNKNEEGLQQALDVLVDLYKDASETTGSDYDVVGQIKVGEDIYTVTWTSDKDGVKVKESSKTGFFTIDVDEKTLTEITYTLTATITDAKGNTITKTYTRKVPAYAVNTWEEYIAAEKGTEGLVVRGVVTGIVSKSQGAGYNCLFLQDSTGGAYYLYGMEKDPIADLSIEIGMTVEAKGNKDVYNGTHELKEAVTEIISTEKTPVTPLDMTETYKNAADLKAEALVKFQSSLVTIKGVEITGQDATNGYYKFTFAGKESYVRISGSTCAMDKAAQDAFKALHTEKTGYTADVTGIISIYNGAFYLVPVSADAFSNVRLAERTDAEKIDFELEQITLPELFTENAELTLALKGGLYENVIFAWTITGEGAAFDATTGKLTLTVGDAPATVTLSLTATCGEATKTAEYTIALTKFKTQKDIVEALYKLESGASLPGKYTLSGVIVKIDNPYDASYDNITVTIMVEGMLDKTVQCFRLKGEGADKLAVGDNITVEGVLKRYNNTYEFDSGCQLKSAKTPAELYDAVAGGATLEGNFTMTGVIETIDTPYDEGYKNITVTIKVGEKLIQCFRLSGTGVADLKVGDTITVCGPLSKFNDKIQFNKPVNVAEEPGEAPVLPSIPDGVTEIAVDTPYYLAGLMSTGNLFFDGTVSSGRINGVADKATAVVVKLEAAATAGEYYIYFMKDGVKTYLIAKENKSAGFDLATEKTDAAIWVVDATAKSIVSKAFSTRGIATQVGSTYSNFSFYATSNFTSVEYAVSWFVAAEGGNQGGEGGGSTTETFTIAPGIYTATYTKESAMAGTVVYTYTMVLGADGSFSYSVTFPMMGEIQAGETLTGTYAVSGNTFTVTPAEGAAITGTLTADNTLVITLTAFNANAYEVTFTPAVFTIAPGTYTATYTKESAMAGTVVYTYTMVLGADGSFSYSVTFPMMGEIQAGETLTGTYAVSGNTFTVTPAEGAAITGTLTADNTLVITLTAFNANAYEVTFTPAAAHEHVWGEEWASNETHHWHECTADGCDVTEDSAKDGYAEHVFTDGACDCGYTTVLPDVPAVDESKDDTAEDTFA